MNVSKNFNHLIDIKFPCLKLTTTPDWPWQDFNEAIFKMTEDAISFLGRENKTQIKPPRNWTE